MTISAAWASVATLGWGRASMSRVPSSVGGLSDAGMRFVSEAPILGASGPLTSGLSILRANLIEQRLEAIEARREALSGSRMKAQSS